MFQRDQSTLSKTRRAIKLRDFQENETVWCVRQKESEDAGCEPG